jgi:hypothetical protein
MISAAQEHARHPSAEPPDQPRVTIHTPTTTARPRKPLRPLDSPAPAQPIGGSELKQKRIASSAIRPGAGRADFVGSRISVATAFDQLRQCRHRGGVELAAPVIVLSDVRRIAEGSLAGGR